MARKAKGSFGWRLLLVPAGLALLALKIGLALLLGEAWGAEGEGADLGFKVHAPHLSPATC